MVSLSPAGGHGTSSVEDFCIKDLLYVRRAVATVDGDETQTEITVTLEEVDLLGVLTLDRLVMHLVSTPGKDETSISPSGSTIEGLKIKGQPIELNCQSAFYNTYPTYSGLESAYFEGKMKGMVIEPGSLGAPCVARTLDGCTTKAGDVRATLYPLDQQRCGLPVENGGLRVKDFGTLYLGEYRLSKTTRQLTMLRVELGCDQGGGVGLGSGIGNGHEEPPG